MKILLIARHFPPLVSGGSRRAAALYNGLRAAGADVSVVAPNLADDVPGLVASHPQPIPSGNHTPAPIRDAARNWLLIPDPDIRWANRATQIALEWVSTNGAPDWIITSAPPESIHACGAALKRELHCRWAADFRDNWLESPLRANRRNQFRAFLERQWARQTLRHADALFCVNTTIQAEIGALMPEHPTYVLEQSAEPPLRAHRFDSSARHAIHTGSFQLSDPMRELTPLLDVFCRARALNADIQLHLVGRLSAAEENQLNASAVRADIINHGVQDAETVSGFQAGADVGIVVAATQSSAVPGKLFEYAAADLPVAIIGGSGWPKTLGWQHQDAAKVIANIHPGLILPRPRIASELGEDLLTVLRSKSSHAIQR